MPLLRTDSLPSGRQWLYELKRDGYRAIAFKQNGGREPSRLATVLREG
jgi:ATP-dependent DNA ligase